MKLKDIFKTKGNEVVTESQVEENLATQKSHIKAYLKNGYGISQMEALTKFGCFRLSAIIFRIKNDDKMEISSYWGTTKGVGGKDKRFKVYYLSEFEERSIRARRND